ncbi:MAG: hypothetical protein E7I47_16360 [Clostridium sp.]|uniref:hypothetical protein n=1 Tax=Clostridium sp. TaxID=1506 RepID=UPI002913F7C1|nr:hypothetical protein [Clostridium sp.]MDU4320868.1 hypothetical protein [Clostridium sp.]
MIFNDNQVQDIYKFIIEWLSSKSFGGYARKSDFKYFQKMLWQPILEVINNLMKKEILTKEEKEFLSLTVYDKYIFRILSYNPKAQKYVVEMQEYQSWSSSIKGLLNIPGMHGDKLLLIGKSDIGINIFGLLKFLKNSGYIYNHNQGYSLDSINGYIKENEIAYKTSLDKIEKIIVVNSSDLSEYNEKFKREIPRELWGRKSFY